MRKETLKHIKTQILASGISNALLNAFFTWLMNREMAFTPGAAVAVDTLFTTGFVSCLVTFPTAYFTRKAVKAGLPLVEKENEFVNRFPRKPVRLWLTVWLAFLSLFEILLFLALRMDVLEGIDFLPLVIGKFFVYGLMGGGVGAFVALRQLQPEKETN